MHIVNNRKYLFIVLLALPSAHAATTFTILDQYTDDGVPMGASYEELEYYNQYVDAGSDNESPFVIDKLTSHEGGILFYYSTELISKENANTFRLTSTTGLFDFTSFDLQDLESYHDDPSMTTIPEMTITSNTGLTQTFSSSVSEDNFEFEGEIFTSYNYFFGDAGVQTMDWTDVTWVDFTTQYTKAKVSDFVLTTEIATIPEPSSAMIVALLTLGVATRRRRTNPA
jgi:hypothetical protein